MKIQTWFHDHLPFPPDPILTWLLVAGDGVCVDVFLIFLLTDDVVLYVFSCLIGEIRLVTPLLPHLTGLV